MLKLKVIHGSTRPGRAGFPVAEWAAEAARAHNNTFEVELVDLADIDLPLLDEPNHPRMQAYTKEHTRRWAKIIGEADAFVFVTPEYDYFPPAALINAVQCLAVEWGRKPAGIVSYAYISGGLRAAQELRMLLGNLGCVAIPQVVPVPMFPSFIEDGKFKPTEPMSQGQTAMLTELAEWANGLAAMRNAA